MIKRLFINVTLKPLLLLASLDLLFLSPITLSISAVPLPCAIHTMRQRYSNPGWQVCTNIQVTDNFSLTLSLNLHIKSIIILTVTTNVSSTCWVAKRMVNNRMVKKFRSRWNNYKTDARKAGKGSIESH